MGGLSSDWLLRVHEAALAASLPDSRDTLLSLLPADARQRMPPPGGRDVGAVQLRDLTRLNDIASQGDPEPLVLWLRAAERLSQGFAASAKTFADARAALTKTFADARAALASNLAQPTAPAPEADRPPPRAAAAKPSEVVAFITSAFSAADLRIFVATYLPELANHINWGGPLAQVAFDLVHTAKRHGVLNPAFFDALVTERPGRADEIEQLRLGR